MIDDAVVVMVEDSIDSDTSWREAVRFSFFYSHDMLVRRQLMIMPLGIEKKDFLMNLIIAYHAVQLYFLVGHQKYSYLNLPPLIVILQTEIWTDLTNR